MCGSVCVFRMSRSTVDNQHLGTGSVSVCLRVCVLLFIVYCVHNHHDARPQYNDVCNGFVCVCVCLRCLRSLCVSDKSAAFDVLSYHCTVSYFCVLLFRSRIVLPFTIRSTTSPNTDCCVL